MVRHLKVQQGMPDLAAEDTMIVKKPARNFRFKGMTALGKGGLRWRLMQDL